VRSLMRLLERAIDREASSRPAALVRIGLALVLLARFADELTFRGAMDGVRFGVVVAFWVAVCAMLVGWRSRVSTAVTAVVLSIGVWRFGQLQNQPGWTHHHVYLLLAATLCTAIAPCGRSYSIDRWRAVKRAARAGAPPPAERGLVWGQTLIAVQLSAVYFWGAVDKLNPGWLRGEKFEAQLLDYVFDSDPPAIAGWPALLVALSVGTVALEFALAIGLWFRRARPWLIPAGVALHVLIYVTLPVRIFSVLSILLYVAYFDPDEVHRAIDRMSGSRTEEG
jgi:hypothetical protein